MTPTHDTPVCSACSSDETGGLSLSVHVSREGGGCEGSKYHYARLCPGCLATLAARATSLLVEAGLRLCAGASR